MRPDIPLWVVQLSSFASVSTSQSPESVAVVRVEPTLPAFTRKFLWQDTSYESSFHAGKSFRPEKVPNHPPFSSQPPGHEVFQARAARARFGGCTRDSRRDVLLEKRHPDDAYDAWCRGGGWRAAASEKGVSPISALFRPLPASL